MRLATRMTLAKLFRGHRPTRPVNHPVCPCLPCFPSPFLPAACGFAAALAIFIILSILGPASARGAVIGTTNTLDNVAYTTPMWSLADPFAFQTISNNYTAVTNHGPRIAALEVATNPEAVAAAIAAKMNIASGASTNQSLYGAVFLNAASFTNASGGAAGALSYDPASGAFAGGPAGAAAVPLSYGTHTHTNLVGSSTNWLDGNGVKWYTAPAASPAQGPPVPPAYADALVVSYVSGTGYNGPASNTVFHLSLNAGDVFQWTSGVWTAQLTVSLFDKQNTELWYWSLYNGVGDDRSWMTNSLPLPAPLLPAEGNTASTGTVGLAVLGLSTNALPLLTRAETEDWTVAPHDAFLTNAWQNPVAATNWTWTSDGNEITLTSYTGPNDVVIPDMLDGLPVTGFGTIFREHTTITTVGGGRNIETLISEAFKFCVSLYSVELPGVTYVGARAFFYAPIYSAIIPGVTFVGDEAFSGCGSLTNVTISGNAPEEASDVLYEALDAVVYVTDPLASGWGATWNGAPVVRMPLYGDGSNLTGITAAQVGAVATNDTRYLAALTNGAATINGVPLTNGAAITIEAGDEWTVYPLNATRTAYNTSTLSTFAAFTGTGIGVAGGGGSNSNTANTCAFGISGMCPPDTTNTNLVWKITQRSGASTDGQAIYFRVSLWNHNAATSGNQDFVVPVASGIATLTVTQAVYQTAAINHTRLGDQATDTACDSAVVCVRYKWIP